MASFPAGLHCTLYRCLRACIGREVTGAGRRYRSEVDEAHELQARLTARDAELSRLQTAVSDLQVYLFQERDQVLRLHAENDRLKVGQPPDLPQLTVITSSHSLGKMATKLLSLEM